MDCVFVSGLPRSGTSLVTGILSICGGWVGETIGPTPENKKGGFENFKLRENYVKSLLTIMGKDPLGLYALPSVGSKAIVTPSVWRGLVLNVAKSQGFNIESDHFVYKDAKLILCYRQWQAAFPEAKWVIVRREKERIINSIFRAEPMARRFQYNYKRISDWHDKYMEHLNFVVENNSDNVIEIWPDEEIFKNLFELKAKIKDLGLVWRQKEVEQFIDDELWGFKSWVDPETGEVVREK